MQWDADVWQVKVGGTETPNQFIPHNVAANAGDMLTFMFLDSKNSVVQTSADQPCTQVAGGEYYSYLIAGADI
jgi:hypothetical protein